MSWELSVTQRGAIMAEHIRRSDDCRMTLGGERTRFMQHEDGALDLDYLPGRGDAIRPCMADYQELADVTGRTIRTATQIITPRQ